MMLRQRLASHSEIGSIPSETAGQSDCEGLNNPIPPAPSLSPTQFPGIDLRMIFLAALLLMQLEMARGYQEYDPSLLGSSVDFRPGTGLDN